MKLDLSLFDGATPGHVDIVERLGMGKCAPGTVADPQECEAPEGECMCAIQSEAAETIRFLRAACLEMKQALESLLAAYRAEMIGEGLHISEVDRLAEVVEARKALSRFKDKDNG